MTKDIIAAEFIKDPESSTKTQTSEDPSLELKGVLTSLIHPDSILGKDMKRE
jgi:hypothetical protein